MRSTTTTIAVGIFLAILLVATALVLTTGLRVEDLGPVIVFAIAFVGVGVLLLAPASRNR